MKKLKSTHKFNYIGNLKNSINIFFACKSFFPILLTSQKVVFSIDWREERWGMFTGEYRVSFWYDENALKIDSGDGCPTF